ncbi:MAG: hypothetical protein ACYDCG_13390 [Candidatus Acidiferrales bacterium]
MNPHRSYQARVMNLNSGYAVSYQESALFFVNSKIVRKQAKPLFKDPRALVSFLR